MKKQRPRIPARELVYSTRWSDKKQAFVRRAEAKAFREGVIRRALAGATLPVVTLEEGVYIRTPKGDIFKIAESNIHKYEGCEIICKYKDVDY